MNFHQLQFAYPKKRITEVEKVTEDPRTEASCVCYIGQKCQTFDGAILTYEGDCRLWLLSHKDFLIYLVSSFRSSNHNLSYPQGVEVLYKKDKILLEKIGFSASAVVFAYVSCCVVLRRILVV